jgi:hypothetical protein
MLNSAGLITEFSNADARAEQTRSMNWLKKQQSNVAALLKKNGIK